MTFSTERNLFGRWLVSCAAGELLGIGVAAGVGYSLNVTVGEPDTAAKKALVLAAMVLAGVLEGSAIGTFQWRVLRHRFPRITARAWVGATVAIAVLGWFFGMLPSTLSAGQAEPITSATEPSLGFILLMSALMGAGAGAAFGFFQWWVLRHHAERAGRWILANLVGWGLGMPWICLAASLPTENTGVPLVVLMGAVAGSLTGLSVALATGVVLVRLRPREPV